MLKLKIRFRGSDICHIPNKYINLHIAYCKMGVLWAVFFCNLLVTECLRIIILLLYAHFYKEKKENVIIFDC